MGFYTILGIFTLPAVMVSFWVYLLMSPCIPTNLGFSILQECKIATNEPLTHLQLLSRIALSTISSWIVMFPVACCVLEYLVFSCIPCVWFLAFCDFFKEYARTHQKLGMAGISKMWRQLKILVAIYNFVHQSVLNIMLTTTSCMGFIVGAYCIFGLNKNLNITQLLMFAVVLIDTVVVALDVGDGVKGKVNVKSTECLKSVGMIENFRKGKQNDSYIKAMHNIKLYVGYSNYYDQKMPLNILHFNAYQTVNLLLL